MKNFLLSVLCFIAALPVFAEQDFNYSAQIILKKDASADIHERITFYTDSVTVLTAFKRTIDTDKKLKKISIFINGKSADFVKKINEEKTHISALVNPHLRTGKNYIALSYTIPEVVYSAYNKDIFKWNLNLAELPYKLKKGKILFKVDGTHITKNTLIKVDKKVFPIEEDKEFSLTPFLNKDISLDLSFEQGFFEGHSVIFHYFKHILNLAPIFVMFFMLIYSYILWYKYGQDPKGPFVTEYNPPKKITSVFAKYLLNMKKPFDYSYFALALISLSLKGYIEICDYHGKICVKSLNGSSSVGLYEEDKLIYERLFAYSTAIILDMANATYISDAINALYHKMENKKHEFFNHNSWYAVAPCMFLLLSFLLFFTLEGTWQIIATVCFTITLIAFIFFLYLIRNVSPEFIKLYNQIMGFKQYMEIAESGRAKFSNPFDRERLFCDNLDYAYAFGIGPKILKLFSKKIDPSILMGINCMHQDKTVLILSALMEPLNL